MNEKKLIKKCQNGNKDAFNELITFYYPFIFKFLIKLTNNKDTTDDIVQDTFLKMIKNIDKFNLKGKASFSTYLITIAKNTYIDFIRKNSKELQELDIDLLEDKIPSEYNYLIHEDYNALLDKINKLPSNLKEVIKLKYLEGYTLEEISKILGIQSKTIKSRLFEGRKKLKQNMKEGKIYE